MRYNSDKERKEARDAAVRKATAKYQASKKRINVYFDDFEYEAIQSAAEKEGITPGRFVRDAAYQQAVRYEKKR